MDATGFDGTPQRGARREEATLPDHVVERARTHALRERTQTVAADRQQIARSACAGNVRGVAA